MQPEPLLKYNPSLDGLRFMAVLLVIVAHWVPSSSILNTLPNGGMGVNLFFVLSGYLITSILLGFKAAAEKGSNSFWGALGHFYIRRTLRIFPIYYATLLLLYLLPDVTGTSIRQTWPIYALFLENYYMYWQGRFDGILGHFWTLAVEEQFYLLWGPAVLFLPIRRLWWVAVIMVGVGILTRMSGLFLHESGVGSPLYFLLAPACFDGFALGALASLAVHVEQGRAAVLQRFLGALSVSLLGVLLFLGIFDGRGTEWVGQTLIVTLAGYLVLGLAVGRAPTPLKRFLGFWPLVAIGRMSYGIYVYHNLVPHFGRSLRSFLEKRGLAPDWLVYALSEQGSAKYVVWTGALLLMAFASWRYFESPINAIKDRFGYENR
jgi:peptidoglycan/LPS O-acetylase OafA/YrhL